MSASSAELSSLAATVEELIRRLGPLSETYLGAQRDDLAAELFEVERSLTAAQRRLYRLVQAPGA